MANQHDFRTYQHAVNHEAPDYEKFRPYFGWVNVDTVQKTMEQSTQWGVSLPNTFPMKKHDRIPSTTPGAEPPRDARDSGSARSHSTHLETSSSNRP